MSTGPTPESGRRRFIIPGFIALSAIWGASFLFIKVGIEELHPVYVATVRVWLGALAMLTLLVILRHRLPRSPRVWAHLAVVGTLGIAIPFSLFGYGEQHIPSLLAGIWNATTPLVALPLSALLFRTEQFTARKAAGIAIGFVGVLVVLGVWQGVGGAELAGQLMCFGAAASYGVVIPYIKRFLAHEPMTGLALVAGQVVSAAVVLAVAAPLIAGAPPAPTSLSGEVIGSMLALGVFGTGFAFLIHFRNIRLVGASAASLVTYLVPVFAVLVGVIVLNETLHWFQPVGALIVLSGIAVMQGLPVSFRRRRAESTLATPAPAGQPASATAKP
ncbi:MAG TPA: DMT family transporter [Natronosporangium sp.]